MPEVSVKNYKELGVWNKAVALAVQVCKMTKGFPPDERFALSAQVRRAATSVPANIAEGWGRGSTKEYIQYLLIARGSLMEVETHAVIAHQLQYLTRPQIESLQQQIEEIGKMLNGLIQALRSPRNPGSPS
jgi:four helix bundle protein